MDGRGWSAGLRKMEAGTKAAAGRMAGGMAGMIGGVFAVGFLVSATRRIVQHADQVHKTAVRIGASTDTIQKFDFAATQSGATMSDVEKSFINTAKAMESAKQGLTTHIRAFQAFGITMQMLNVMSPEQVFLKIADAIEKAGGAMDKAKSLQDIMGRGGKALIPAFVSGFTGLAGSAPEGIDEATIQNLVRFNDELDRLKRETLPAAASGVSVLADMFHDFTEVSKKEWADFILPPDLSGAGGGKNIGKGSVQPVTPSMRFDRQLELHLRELLGLGNLFGGFEDSVYGSTESLRREKNEVDAMRGRTTLPADTGIFLGSNVGQGPPLAKKGTDPAIADAAAAAAAKAWSKPSLQLNSLQRIGAAVSQSADPVAIERSNNKLLTSIARNTKKLADETDGI